MRVDDRAQVRFILKNLSPLDICSRTASPPTATVETPVPEALVSTIAGMFGGAAPAAAQTQPSMNYEAVVHIDIGVQTLQHAMGAATCKIKSDPEYAQIQSSWDTFINAAKGLIGNPTPGGSAAPDDCGNLNDQSTASCKIGLATRKLAEFTGTDYRGDKWRNFKVNCSDADCDSRLRVVKNAYSQTLTTISDSGNPQSMVDEMKTWATDLHKKYDYMVPPADSGPPSPPPPVPGVLMVAPTSLSFSPSSAATLAQTVQLNSGGSAGAFTATPASDSGWLLLSKAGAGQPSVNRFTDTAPAYGTYPLLVTVNPAGLDPAVPHYGSITVTGTGPARGTTIIGVTLKPTPPPAALDSCTLEGLNYADTLFDRGTAVMSLINDNNKALGSAQATLKAAYMNLVRAEDDFNRRAQQRAIYEDPDGTLFQEINLGTDRKDTSPGYFACVSDVDGKTPTTTNINYSLLYQDVPHWSVSTGALVSFQQKQIIGISDTCAAPTVCTGAAGASNPVGFNTVFAVTDHERVQIVPMAFVNWRFADYRPFMYGKAKKDASGKKIREDQGYFTTHLSGGFGINPNSGTAQPEFFGGLAVGVNRFMFHTGVDYGRREFLGGGFVLGQAAPATLTAAPLTWNYRPAFSIGFSVRVAPY